MVSSNLPGTVADADAAGRRPVQPRRRIRRLRHRHPADERGGAGAGRSGDPRRPAGRQQNEHRQRLGRPAIMTHAITVTGANKRYGDFAALDDVDFVVPVGIADRAARAQRVGQVDAAAGHRRPRRARLGHDHDQRPRRHRRAAAEARHRFRVPALRRVQAPDGARQRRVRAQDPQAAEGRDRGEGRQPARDRRARRLPDPLPQPALRRTAPAHGAGPRAGRRPAGAAARRAVRRAGRQGARGSAGVAAPPARRGARHHRAGDPRPGRRRSTSPTGSRCSTRAASSRSARPPRSTTARPTPS